MHSNSELNNRSKQFGLLSPPPTPTRTPSEPGTPSKDKDHTSSLLPAPHHTPKTKKRASLQLWMLFVAVSTISLMLIVWMWATLGDDVIVHGGNPKLDGLVYCDAVNDGRWTSSRNGVIPVGTRLFVGAEQFIPSSERVFTKDMTPFERVKASDLPERYFPGGGHIDTRFGVEPHKPTDYSNSSDPQEAPESVKQAQVKKYQIKIGKTVVSDEPADIVSARVQQMKGLLAAWAAFADSERLIYWIAHGALIGWAWGGSIMPFDDDLDVQITERGLAYLFMYKNGSYTGEGNRYLLDINANWQTRSYQRQNIIDARFIDTHTGRFIDITALSWTASAQPGKAPDRWSRIQCKSPHKYSLEQIFPLIRTEYEGIPVWRPNLWRSVLSQEYGQRIYTLPHYRNYVYSYSKGRFDLATCEQLEARWINPYTKKISFRTQKATLEYTKNGECTFSLSLLRSQTWDTFVYHAKKGVGKEEMIVVKEAPGGPVTTSDA
ncbi:hypothetical protein SmJEL517_g04362 [Synchytrium microbalum]|uniref:LicD/FKTN/FKRP nucleotidyltransferase domain-containing protein n=1 Tax=Synchytrium microbalum TaxID=1806994 RepID=A0A507BSD3_9FUNG|nr:uncharacterized protein SmJEL517_g04362 [Synchytrium microbalum]TPX32530.1 hypothetical protein SmJEL517_g04362 [Synchytrium microbalum]